MPDPRIFPVERANDGNALVGLVSTLVLAANPNRVDADFVNDDHETPIYLARGNPAALNEGIKLLPGGSYHIGTNNLFLGEIYAISIGFTLLTISEGVKP